MRIFQHVSNDATTPLSFPYTKERPMTKTIRPSVRSSPTTPEQESSSASSEFNDQKSSFSHQHHSSDTAHNNNNNNNNNDYSENNNNSTINTNNNNLLANHINFTNHSGATKSEYQSSNQQITMTTYNAKTDSTNLHQPRYTQYGTNLTDETLGSRVIFATDEFFAVADNLLKRTSPGYDPNAYCAQGKVMDGWESRRRRLPGHDWCVIRLAYRGTIVGFEVDTAYFTGNFAPRISIQAANIPEYAVDIQDEWMPGAFDRFERGGGIRGSKASPNLIAAAEKACHEHAEKHEWHTLVPMVELKPGYAETRMHYFSVHDRALRNKPVTHLRLNFFPDGGVARLKAFGSVNMNFERDVFAHCKDGKPVPVLDLSSMALGGRGLACSNKHFGVPRNLLKPGRGIDMGDGWETARHMDRPMIIETNSITGLVDTDLGDWCILQLGTITALVEKLEIDTCHFKGNFPESVMVEAGCAKNFSSEEVNDEIEDDDDVSFDDLTITWFPLLKRTKLGPDKIFTYELENEKLEYPPDDVRYISHIRVSIFPDGGISRVRVHGRPMPMAKGMKRVMSGLNGLII